MHFYIISVLNIYIIVSKYRLIYGLKSQKYLDKSNSKIKNMCIIGTVKIKNFCTFAQVSLIC